MGTKWDDGALPRAVSFPVYSPCPNRPETIPSNDMKFRLSALSGSIRALLLLSLPVGLAGQDFGDTGSSASVSEEDDELIILSPFTVEGEEVGGYTARTTLGGTRIRTELRDLATPLSVVTADFLQDTASKNNQDLLNYTTNTEVGGLFGNWGGFGNTQGISDRDALLTPNNNTRIRGLEQADNTRNFFLTDIPWDSYNTDRIDIQRGPNSILFGVGSPAGIINGSTIQARMDGNSGKIENELSSFGSVRWVGQYNWEVIDDLLAVRVAGLANDQKFRQEPAFNDDRRLYGTATFQPQVLPKEWAGRLTIRGSWETAEVESNYPRMLPPTDAISLWFDDPAGDGVVDPIGLGKGVIDMFLYNQGGGGDPFRGPLSSSSVLNPRYQPATEQIDPGALNNGGLGFFFKNGESRPFFVSRQAPRVYPGALAADGSVDNAIDIPYGSPMRVAGFNRYAIAVDRMDTTEGRESRFPLASRNYYKDRSLTDTTVFDFFNNLVDGDNKREYKDWDAMNVSISQTFLDNRFGLEFVYDEQNYK
ncbi:MAG: Plug domain-containing protein [Verrucomicrobia bacterium]|nr:MAG: Plug domain-containing protein [Verrucomicrobiota bacterium]